MKISIQPKFSKADIKKIVAERMKRIDEVLLLRLQKVGENFVNNARVNGSYTDRTGNLRSSIGYVILKNGLQYSEGGWILVKEGGGGIEVGKKFAEEIAKKYPIGWILVCVAGEQYASAVEARGFDVITSSAFTAKNELQKSLKELSEKI